MNDNNNLNTSNAETTLPNVNNSSETNNVDVAPVVNVPVDQVSVQDVPESPVVENTNPVVTNEVPASVPETPAVNDVVNPATTVAAETPAMPVADGNVNVVDTPVNNIPPVQPNDFPGIQPNVPQQPNNVPPVQPNMNNVPPVNTTKKTPIGLFIGIGAGVLVLIAVILLLVLKPFGGGGGALSGPKGVVEKYVNNLIVKGYGENFALVSIPENHFVETSDYVEFAQKKSDYQGLDGFKVKTIQELSLEETKGMYTVILTNESEMIKNISINVENVNGWKVVEDNLFIKDWSIIVPKGTKVTIGGKEVPQTLLMDDATSKNTVKYNIPAITSTKKTIVLNNPLQSMTVEETPLSANSGKKYEMVLNNQEIVDKAYAYIKDTWNQMYTSYVGKENVSDVASKYFDSSVDINNVDVYYNQSLGKIGDNSEKDFKILEVIAREGSPNYVLTDELIQLNFGYKLSWIYAPSYSSKENPKEMTRYSKIILKYDGSSFKIYDVLDTRLFSYANYFTSDY